MEDISREELLRSKTYWTITIQNKLFNAVTEYMKHNNMNKTQFAEKLGVSKGYVTQLLNGDFDNKISKLVELSLAIGLVPEINFRDVDTVIEADRKGFTANCKYSFNSYTEATINDEKTFAA